MPAGNNKDLFSTDSVFYFYPRDTVPVICSLLFSSILLQFDSSTLYAYSLQYPFISSSSFIRVISNFGRLNLCLINEEAFHQSLLSCVTQTCLRSACCTLCLATLCGRAFAHWCFDSRALSYRCSVQFSSIILLPLAFALLPLSTITDGFARLGWAFGCESLISAVCHHPSPCT